MTLIITAGCRDYVVQVSDRRFTYEDAKRPRVATDEGNKELVVRTPLEDFAVAFTGRGVLDGVPTGDWLLDRLSQSKSPEKGLAECIEVIRLEAERTFSDITRREGKVPPHTFLVSGFTRADGMPFVRVVTNCETENFKAALPSENFAVHQVRSKYPYWHGGYTPALKYDPKAATRSSLRKGIESQQLMADLVRVVRTAAMHKKHGGYIGSHCMAVCVRRTGEVQAFYYPTHDRPIVYAPNLIDTFPAKGGGVGHLLMKDFYSFGRGARGPWGIGPTRGGVRIDDRRISRPER